MGDCFNISFIDIIDEYPHKFGVFNGKEMSDKIFYCKRGDKPYTRFFYVVSGTTIFNKGSEHELIASAGDIVYLPCDVEYFSQWKTEEVGEFISINFGAENFHVALPNQLCIAIHDKHGKYLKMFQSAYAIWINGTQGYKIELLSAIYEFLYQLFLDTNYTTLKQNYNAIYKSVIYLENHYTEDVDVAFLAKHCHMSESGFRKHFKNYTKMSPITYRNYLRIKKAYELLQSGEYTIVEAANSVNIPDICYFHKLFKKFYHSSPKKLLSGQ